MILGLLLGLSWFAVFFGCHLAVIQFANPADRPRINQRLFLGGAVALAVTIPPFASLTGESELYHGGWWMAAVWGELAYVALFCLYMPFYYTVMASLSVRTIVLLLHEPEKSLPIVRLRQRFASHALVRGRLAVMAKNGFLIARAGDTYALAQKGRSVAVLFLRLKTFWNLGAGG
jgi:hypothetical protein